MLRRRLRNSRPEVSCKKAILRNFAQFTGKHLRQSLFFNKVAACNFIKKETLAQACNFIKKRLWYRCFPVNFVKFLRTPLDDCYFIFFIPIFWQWLLDITMFPGQLLTGISKVYSESCQTSRMDLFTKIVHDW